MAWLVFWVLYLLCNFWLMIILCDKREKGAGIIAMLLFGLPVFLYAVGFIIYQSINDKLESRKCDQAD